MCQVVPFGARHVVRFAFAGLAAALLAGCADSSHFIGDPLGNPFKTASAVPSATSASNFDMAPPPAYSPRAAVRSQSLMPSASPSRVASYEAPSHASPRLSSDYRPPRTERTASIAAPSGHGSWSSEGGMAVIAGNGDTASVLGARYNVPTEALLRANDFTSAAAIQPGTRVVIPVYNANGGGAPSRVAKAEPVRHDHSSRERLLARNEPAKHEVAKHEVVKREAAKPAKLDLQARRDAERNAKLAKYEKAEREAKEAKLARYEKAEREAKLTRTDDGKKMKWAKGAQPAKLAEGEKGRGREKALAKLDRKAETKMAQESRKVADKPAKAEKPLRMAKAEPAPVVEDVPRKAAPAAPVDTTPTASLPPAAERTSVAANGAPEFRWPAHGRIIQGFKSGGNDGINIAVPEGTAVKAAESGTVAYAGSEIKGFGNLVLIRHPNGYVTAYANNGDIEVKRGEQVKRGQTIAKSGQSGNVASPQLHFELRKGSTPVDPTRYLAGL